jgi:hypothetical protein
MMQLQLLCNSGWKWKSNIFEPRYYIRQYTHQYPAADASDDVKGLFVLPGWQQSLLTGILSCGTFFGALIAGDVADRIVRR